MVLLVRDGIGGREGVMCGVDETYSAGVVSTNLHLHRSRRLHISVRV